MYPDGDLNRLAFHKATLRTRIRVRREETAAAAAVAVKPLQWLDRALAWWKKAKPIAALLAIPVALLAKRVIFKRFHLFRKIFRWGPAIFGAVRLFGAIRHHHEEQHSM